MKRTLRSFIMGMALVFALVLGLAPVQAQATPITITTVEGLKEAAAHPEYVYQMYASSINWPSTQTTVTIPGNVELIGTLQVPANISLSFADDPYKLTKGKKLINYGKLVKSDGKTKASLNSYGARLEGKYDLIDLRHMAIVC